MTAPAPPPDLPLVLDPGVRVLAAGRVLLGGDPPRLVRLRAAARPWAARERGPAEGRLARQLLDAGLVHPRPAPAQGGADVTVVVPVRDRAAELDRCLAAVGTSCEVLVVDDGSADPGAVAEVCRRHGAQLLPLPQNRGPGPARDAGLAATGTPFVALLDSDCVPSPGWLPRLLGHLDDPAVGAVAPRVRARRAAGLLGRYAAARGPLDLGPHPAPVRPGGRVSYVPTAALLVRRAALPPAPVFDPALRYGEDVDLVWRLHDAGWSVRYDPSVEVEHEEPGGWGAWLRRRHAYGTSAAPLAARYPGRLAPLVLSPWRTGAVALLCLRRPVPALALAAVPAVRLQRLLVDAGAGQREAAAAAAASAGRALGATATGLGGAGTVLVLPLLAGLLAVRRRRPVPAVLALVAPPLLEALARRPRLDPLTWTALRLLDDVAYGSGVWRGSWSARSAAALRPRVTLAAGPRRPGPRRAPSPPAGDGR